MNKRLSLAVGRGHLSTVEDILDDEELDWLEGYILLRSALKNRHSAIATLLLRKGCKVNCSTWTNKETALHFATISGDFVNIELLLQNGAHVNAKNERGCTPLHNAVGSNGQTRIVDLLLKNKADVNITTGNGDTPLQCAYYGNLQVIQMLLDYGSNINSPCSGGKTPLHRATAINAERVVDLLLRRGANIQAIDKEGKTALYHAVGHGYSEIVQRILRYGPDINHDVHNGLVKEAVLCRGSAGKWGYTTKASHHGSTKIIQELLQYGFSLTAEDANDEVFRTAIEKGYLKIIEGLFKLGASANCFQNCTEGSTPLSVAVYHTQVEVTKLLIRHGADVNSKSGSGKHVLFTAVEKGDSNMILLLVSKASLSERDIKEILMTAVTKGRREVVELFLQQPMFKDCVKKRHDIVNIAVNAQNTELVKYLLQCDANINPLGENCVPALHVAALKGNQEICEMLLEKGANVNNLKPMIDDHSGFRFNALAKCLGINLQSPKTITSPNSTALHIATENGHEHIVKLLLKYGAEIDCEDGKGNTALVIACIKGRSGILQFLLDSGSDINFNANPDFLNALPRITQRTILMTLSSHICKMIFAKLYVKKILVQTLLPYVKQIYSETHLRQTCEAEIEVMKTEKIASTCTTTFFHVMTKRSNQLKVITKNEAIDQVFSSSSNDVKKKYPLYAGMITCNFKKAKQRAMLLEKATVFFENDMPFLPYICTQRILHYLNNKDLKVMFEASLSNV